MNVIYIAALAVLADGSVIAVPEFVVGVVMA